MGLCNVCLKMVQLNKLCMNIGVKLIKLCLNATHRTDRFMNKVWHGYELIRLRSVLTLILADIII